MYKFSTNTLFIGKKAEYVPICQSTNDIAAAYLQKGQAIEGTVIWAGRQEKGRGQLGSSWEAEAGQNLTFSVILRPSFLLAQHQFRLSAAVALSVCDFLQTHLKEEVKVKWPNDVYIADGKCCGILIENTLRHGYIDSSVVGIGLNVNQRSFASAAATSLSAHTDKSYVLPDLLADYLAHLERRYLQLRAERWATLKADYLKQMYWYQELRLYARCPVGAPEKEQAACDLFEGEILGIHEDGRLAIAVGGKVHYFANKEVRFLR